MPKQKFYAIKSENEKKIVTTWDECLKLTHGVKGVLFKSFGSREEAQAWLDGMEAPAPDGIRVFVDGSFSPGFGPAGWAFVVTEDDKELARGSGITAFDAESRNIDGEVMASFQAMKWLDAHNQNGVICHDYEGIARWAKGEWQEFTADLSAYKNVYVRLYYTGSTAIRAVDDIELTTYVPVTIASSGYSTLGTTCGLDFANASPAGLEAYVVPSITASAVSLSDIDEAPASTGVVLKGTPGETYTIPVKATAAAVGTNYLKAAVTATTLADGSFYIMKGGKFCLVTGAENAAARTVPAGKAYLLASDVPSEARELTFVFDDVTAIETVKAEKTNNEYYNLAGQRVANPTKGLYIVNGKKVIIK